MKKIKELLMLLIPFIALSCVSIIYFALNAPNGVRYLKIMLADPFFKIAIIHTFVPSLTISFTVCILYKVISFFLKIRLRRKTKYIILFLIATLSSAIYILVITRGFDAVNNTVFTLQVGIIVTFIFWLAELVKGSLKKLFRFRIYNFFKKRGATNENMHRLNMSKELKKAINRREE